MINGIINVYKEPGFTSHDVVNVLRGIAGQRKIGHTGTLDPDAEGVLVVCLGKATKVSDMLTDSDKTYRARVLLGCTTDTLDTSGEVIDRCDIIPPEEEIVSTIMSFKGEIEQVPPMYSAIRVGGKRLYELAREGKEVERKSRRITIYDIEVNRIDVPYVEITVSCSKGTYIRTLCADIGEKLGCGACMDHLLRTRAAGFDVSDSHKLSEIEEIFKSGRQGDIILGTDVVFKGYPRVSFVNDAEKRASNGNPLSPEDIFEETDLNNGDVVRVYDPSGDFYGIYAYDERIDALRPQKIFKEL
ncbi:MAG: tRNA pseudouridine(55) synthase TruB [Eubacterium sp.]|nr:tRNA pseudouridine(55) synthase TruB [Eubacterium sp.]